MGKVGKKLVVYLDQNFISDIAKLKINDKVRKEFEELFDVLHEGFLSEKLVVPVSWFHKIETCLRPDLKEHIKNYQAWMGQVDLRSNDHIYRAQLGRSLRMYKSNLQEDMDYFEAFSDNPDNPLQSFRISVDPGLEKIYNVKDRKQLSLQIEENKNRSICEGTNFIQQKKLEIEAYANGLLNNYPFGFSFLRLENKDILQSFIKSEFFESIPIVDIGSSMWARIIAGHPHRQVQAGDSTDVDVVATYMPYVDVIALDKFMANNVRFLELDKTYKAHVFDSSTSGLQDLINFIRSYVEMSEPVNKKDVAIFVLSDKKIKDESISFFQNLDNQCKKYHIDLYGFDDGKMPKYRYEKIEIDAPFSGIADVKIIDIDPKASKEKIIELCREESYAEHFVLINFYRKLDDNFIDTMIKNIKNGKKKILNYDILKK